MPTVWKQTFVTLLIIIKSVLLQINNSYLSKNFELDDKEQFIACSLYVFHFNLNIFSMTCIFLTIS